MAVTFLPGLELARHFYAEAVRPTLDQVAPGLPHSAARLGAGSEVLGFDTVRSTDHDWGPRLELFLHPDDVWERGAALTGELARRLPKRFRGHPTNFTNYTDTVLGVAEPTDGPVRHGVTITDPRSWFIGRLGFDPADGPELLDWLATPTQRLRETVSGEVFHDGLDALRPRRAALTWYPHDVWLYVLGSQWRRIAQEEAFVGRTGEVGDEAGSRVIAARLVRDALRLSLLLRRRYPPYSKWLGTDAAQADAPVGLIAALDAALAAGDWVAREASLCAAYSVLVTEQNALGIAAPLDPSPRQFHDRPFRVIYADRCADALFDRIADRTVARLPRIGAVDQFVDSTDAVGDPPRLRAVTAAAFQL